MARRKLTLLTERLDAIPVEFVGDGKGPGSANVYFVSDEFGHQDTITRDRETAIRRFRELADRRPRLGCTLEDRQVGCLASVEPETDEPGSRLIEVSDL